MTQTMNDTGMAPIEPSPIGVVESTSDMSSVDDSTSAVDTATEAKIRESFAGELKNTTKIIIAQRISSVQEADEIMVLDDGKIVGFGKHEDLLASCEAYQEIYYSQMDKEQEGAAS